MYKIGPLDMMEQIESTPQKFVGTESNQGIHTHRTVVRQKYISFKSY